MNGDFDLFDYMGEQQKRREAPLASRLRPKSLDEVVGQEHILGRDKLLYRAIKAESSFRTIFVLRGALLLSLMSFLSVIPRHHK